MRAMIGFGSHLRGGIDGRSRCSIFAINMLFSLLYLRLMRAEPA